MAVTLVSENSGVARGVSDIKITVEASSPLGQLSSLIFALLLESSAEFLCVSGSSIGISWTALRPTDPSETLRLP